MYASLSFPLLSHAARLLDQLISKFIHWGTVHQNTDKTLTAQHIVKERYNNTAQQRQRHSRRAKFCLPCKRKKDTTDNIVYYLWKYAPTVETPLTHNFFTQRHRGSYRPHAVAGNRDNRAEIFSGSADSS